ncbi:MAG: PQQ-dependent sugar dehydrogenase, partial [Bacteroidota bacterium]
MKKERLIYAVLGILFLSFLVELPPYGIDQPSAIGPFLNDVFPKKSPSHGSWKAVNAFPNLTFTDPVAMEEIPQQNHYYIAGKQGVIWLVEDDENTTEKIVALDIRSEVITSEDAGLINFVLHPEFSEQGSENEGCLFIFYPYHPVVEDGNNARMNRLSKFRTYPGSLEINPASEEILIQDYDPQGWHMGGAMFFDDEGLLYLAFGDGGGSNNEFNSTQQINQRLWAGLVRIDVDNDPTRSHPIRRQPIEFPGKPASFPATFTQGYMIPNDNPWLSEQGAVLEEFYAIGLRSPHRASFDPVEQNIWVGDVGEAKQEEVTILPKGGNAQWPYKEGRDDGPKPTPTTIIGEEVLPTIEYSRTEGISVIGGFVYRGEKWSTYLEGLYIFGDFGTREIWSFNPATSDIILMTSIPEFGVGSKSGISSFATNEAGDIFVLKLYGQNLDGGVVYKLELDEVQLEPIPQLLSETGAFTDLQTLTPAPGLVPYATINPLWSDGAFKKRWIALPNDGTHDSPEEQINFFSNEEWQFPNGTVFVKHFDLPADLRDPNKTQKVETRFFVLDEDGRGYGLTYKWNQEGTEAVLLETEDFQAFEILDEFGVAQEQVWEYPSRRQCMNCHT